MDSPRVLIIEDDETLSQFFSMVLEMLPVRGMVCSDAEQALRELQEAPAALLVTDLLLPGMGGRKLLAHLQAHPELRGQAKIVVMSGTMNEDVRRELATLGVWRMLAKPVTVKAFKLCVSEALESWSASAAEQPSWSNSERAALMEHFAGNETLFCAYRDACRKQFPRDVAAGQAAFESGDTPALRRVAHNLKTVLRTLGHAEAAQRARALEELTSQPSQGHALAEQWHGLRQFLLELVEQEAVNF